MQLFIYFRNMDEPLHIYLWLVCVLLTQLMWSLMRGIFNLFQAALWLANGTSTQIKQNYQESSYKGTVQVMRILCRYKFDPLTQSVGPNIFLTNHERFVDPEYVLKDHVSLFHVSKDLALWVEVDEEISPIRIQSMPFFTFAQYKLARKVIVMPMHIFQKLGQKVGSPKARLIFLSNTSRCGSTLLTRVFSETKFCQAFSEPDCLNALAKLKNLIPDSERDRIFINCINLLCKPLHLRNTEGCFIKLTLSTMVELPHIKKLFPESRFLFLYRDALAVVRSLNKFGKVLPIPAMIGIIGSWSPRLLREIVKQSIMHGEQFEVKLATEFDFAAIMWSSAVRQFLDFREQGIQIAAARYEDIMHHPSNAFQRIFEYCDLPFDSGVVERGMSEDSQCSTPVSAEKLKSIKVHALTNEEKEHVNKISDYFNVPRVTEEFIAPGTITG